MEVPAGSRQEVSRLLSEQGQSDSHGSMRHLRERVPLYSPPRQRQRWDDIQMLPHVNWGDLYFDLFYVAAAYQLSHAFKDSPTVEGFVYFLASYFPVFVIWNEKLLYDARYAPEDNLFHRALEVLHLCLLGLAVSCIQPAEIMKDTQGNVCMTLFTGAYLSDTFVSAYTYYDVIQNAVGGQEARRTGQLEFARKLMGLIFYGLAFAVAVKDYCFPQQLQPQSCNHWPAFLMIAGYLVEVVAFHFIVIGVILPKCGISDKDVFVPINQEYTIHRMGEWVMLMLGESVLSILTIPQRESTNSPSFLVAFFAGILTVTMFQYLFFRTQPAEAKDHAMRRSQGAGYIFFQCQTIYSASLILVGCSYKMMLSQHEMLSQAQEEGVHYDIKERIALVYALSQTVSMLTLDFMIISHRGIKANLNRYQLTDDNGTTKCATLPFLVTGLNLFMALATLSLSQVRNMTLLSVYGCLLVFCQVMLRTIGLKFFPVTIAEMDLACHPQNYGTLEHEPDHRKWPNVTEPVAKHPDE